MEITRINLTFSREPRNKVAFLGAETIGVYEQCREPPSITSRSTCMLEYRPSNNPMFIKSSSASSPCGSTKNCYWTHVHSGVNNLRC